MPVVGGCGCRYSTLPDPHSACWAHLPRAFRRPRPLQVRTLVVCLANSRLLPACAEACVRLAALLARPPTPEAASFCWMAGFAARVFAGAWHHRGGGWVRTC